MIYFYLKIPEKFVRLIIQIGISIIIIILFICEFFTPALVDGFSVDFQWQQALL